MLDRAKLIKELQRVSDRLFADNFQESDLTQMIWQKIADDPTFVHKIAQLHVSWPIPSWSGRLDDLFQVKQGLQVYRVAAVDGSQIYPDKHQGSVCSLINVGSVRLSYGLSEKPVFLDSEPTVFVGDEDLQLKENPQELVNCRRQAFEFAAGLKYSKTINQADTPSVFLFDGSLIFWHLESKDKEVKQKFLISYLDALNSFYEQKMMLAGYISLTKSKELVGLVRIALTELAHEYGLQDVSREMVQAVERMSDSHIVRFFLDPCSRTTVFKNHAKITNFYPAFLHPHFFYLHVGSEIVRIEIPAWIASDQNQVDLVAQMILDQAIKGAGYPVALAEAHEQAVVKGPDRDVFYHLIKKIGMTYKRKQIFSQKVRNKRGVRI